MKLYEITISRKEVSDCKYKCYIPAKDALSAKEKAVHGDWDMHEIIYQDLNDTSKYHIHNVYCRGDLR